MYEMQDLPFEGLLHGLPTIGLFHLPSLWYWGCYCVQSSDVVLVYQPDRCWIRSFPHCA